MYETIASFPRNYVRDLRVFQIRLSNFGPINFPCHHILYFCYREILAIRTLLLRLPNSSVLMGLVSYPTLFHQRFVFVNRGHRALICERLSSQ